MFNLLNTILGISLIFLCSCGQVELNERSEQDAKSTDGYNLAKPSSNAECRKITHDAFKAMLDRGGKVVLPDCSVVMITDTIKIPSNVTITTNPRNPATIRRDTHKTHTLAIAGSNIVIENIKYDFNSQEVWTKYVVGIAFKYPTWWGGAPPEKIENVVIQNVTFFDSTPPTERTPGDNWCINLTHTTGVPMRNILITKNTHVQRPFTQLVAGGHGNGLDGVEISHNTVNYGESNAIAVSSFRKNGDFLTNITVHGNRLINSGPIGVFIGRDGNRGGRIHLRNVCVTKNHITLRAHTRFSHGVYLRGTGENRGIYVNNNIIDASPSARAGHSPRHYTLQMTPGTKVNMYGNEFLGKASKVVSGGIRIDESRVRGNCYWYHAN